MILLSKIAQSIKKAIYDVALTDYQKEAFMAGVTDIKDLLKVESSLTVYCIQAGVTNVTEALQFHSGPQYYALQAGVTNVTEALQFTNDAQVAAFKAGAKNITEALKFTRCSQYKALQEGLKPSDALQFDDGCPSYYCYDAPPEFRNKIAAYKAGVTNITEALLFSNPYQLWAYEHGNVTKISDALQFNTFEQLWDLNKGVPLQAILAETGKTAPLHDEL